MKKKISLKDWNYIGTHNAGAKWIRPFCVYYKRAKEILERA